MKIDIEYGLLKFTDWSKHDELTDEQRSMLIQEKIERARIQHLVTQRILEEVGE